MAYRKHQCVPNQVAHHIPFPCQEVDLRNGFMVMKDRNGRLQFFDARRAHKWH